MNRRYSIALVVLLATLTTGLSQTIEDEWIFSAAYVANESTGGGGTGFFVAREVLTNAYRIFLVSNRHVLAPRDALPEETNRLAKAKVIVTRESHGQLFTEAIDVTLRETNGTLHVVNHPSPGVDIAVLEMSQYVVESGAIRKGYKVGFVPESRFVSRDTIASTHVTIGQQIVMLGYPLNLIEGQTAIAVARSGAIATPADRDFRGRPVFLVDSATVRGSSGSPVFLPLRPYKVGRNSDGSKFVNYAGGYTPGLLGIVAETVADWELILQKTDTFGLPPSKVSVITTANLGVVFRADKISEALDATGIAGIHTKAQTEF
jgi:hypothetical protein